MGTTKSEHLCGIGLTEGTPTIVCSKMQPVSKRSGVYFCHSRACPGCVHYENAKLVNRIVPSLKAALVDGRWVLFGTLTLKHHRRTDPGDLLAGLTKCWNAVNLKLKKTYEGFEYFWSRDFTWSERNGCHFHLHFLLVLDGEDLGTPEKLLKLQDLVFGAWSRRAKSAGFGNCSRDAFFLEVCQTDLSEAQIARYTAKLTKAAFEAVSHEFKLGDVDRQDGLTPWQLMELAYEAPEGSKEKKVLTAAWFSFKRAVSGRRSFGKSGGFWKLAELRVPDPVDQPEIIVPDALDVMASGKLGKEWSVFLIGRRLWKALARLDATEDVQEFLELGACGRLPNDMQRLGFQELSHAFKLSVSEPHSVEIEDWENWFLDWCQSYRVERVA